MRSVKVRALGSGLVSGRQPAARGEPIGVPGASHHPCELKRVGKPNRIALPTHATITAEVRPGSPSRYPAAKWEQVWNPHSTYFNKVSVEASAFETSLPKTLALRSRSGVECITRAHNAHESIPCTFRHRSLAFAHS